MTLGTVDGCGYSCTWIIKYRGYNQAVPSITAVGTSLSGGSTSPSILTETRRPYSSNLEFDPIDYRFLHTDDANINVQITTNGVPAICTGNCGYSFNTYSEITSLSYPGTGTTLSLALSDPTSLGFSVNSVKVTVGG